MKKNVFCAIALICLTLSGGCDRADREQAQRKAEEARAKARELGRKAEEQAKDLKHNVDSSVASDSRSDSAREAAAKLRNGEQDLRVAGDQAGRKLDRAAIIAKVKAKLADEVGLSTVTGIEVDARADTVTLRGNVDSAERKAEAGRAAGEVDGVARVVNELQVR